VTEGEAIHPDLAAEVLLKGKVGHAVGEDIEALQMPKGGDR
jgi:hypothetical protein